MYVVIISYCFYTALFNRMLLPFLTVELWLVVVALLLFSFFPLVVVAPHDSRRNSSLLYLPIYLVQQRVTC